MKKLHGWIDRIEGDIAVVGIYDQNFFFEIPSALIPFAREGDVISIKIDKESLLVKLDHEEKERRLKRIQERRKRLLGGA